MLLYLSHLSELYIYIYIKKCITCNYIVRISVSQLAKLARVPESVAAASLIPAEQQRWWLSSSRSESGHSQGLGAPQGNANVPSAEMGIAWPNPLHKTGKYDLPFQVEKKTSILHNFKVPNTRGWDRGFRTSLLHWQAEFLISHV